jgi:ferredoxin
MKMERGRGGGQGKGRGMGRGGGMGGGRDHGMGQGRGRCTGPGPSWQSGAALVPSTAPNATEANRPKPVESNRCITAMLDNDRCTGCGICIDSCPEEALSVNGSAAIDPGRCTGCGACTVACPNEALSLARQMPARGVTG